MGLFDRASAQSMTMSTAEVRDRLATQDRPTILDVRTAAEFVGDGHIPGALHLPLDRLVEDLGRLDRDREYVTVCRSGARSAQAQRILLRAGFAKTKNMQGGMLRWHGPVVHDGPVRH